MKTGRLDRRITIEVRSVTQNGVGEEVETWSTLASVWAERETTGALQRFTANQVYAEATDIWRVRWYEWGSTLDPLQHRIVYRDRVYDIQGVQEIGRREGLHIVSKSRQDNEAGSN